MSASSQGHLLKLLAHNLSSPSASKLCPPSPSLLLPLLLLRRLPPLPVIAFPLRRSFAASSFSISQMPRRVTSNCSCCVNPSNSLSSTDRKPMRRPPCIRLPFIFDSVICISFVAEISSFNALSLFSYGRDNRPQNGRRSSGLLRLSQTLRGRLLPHRKMRRHRLPVELAG